MSKMTFTSPRATLEETLAFANAVREAGGGNPLDALMPAVPTDPSQCLIARNLNFNCRVGGFPDRVDGDTHLSSDDGWVMLVGDNEALRDRIANALELETFSGWTDEFDYDENEYISHREYGIILPKEIGQVASDFDQWTSGFPERRLPDGTYGYAKSSIEEHVELSTTFGPYVEAAIRETKAHGVFNDKGELIL